MDETETLGKYLRRERELKKISLRELSKNTRVREPILRAIEEDQHDLLPSPTFVKGFLTAYAKYVGLDANDIILRYQQALKGTLDDGPDVKPEKKIGGGTRSPWIFGWLILGGAIVAGLIVFYFFFLHPSKPRVEPLPVKPAEEETPAPLPASPQIAETNLPQKGVQPTPTPAPTPTPTPSPPQIVGTNPPQKGTQPTPVPPSPQIGGTNLPQKENPISLQLKAVEITWVSVTVDDQAEKEMTLRPGETIPLEAANQIYLLVGNAGGLDLLYNGKTLERFGRSGEVVGLIFTPQGLDVKRFEKSKPQ